MHFCGYYLKSIKYENMAEVIRMPRMSDTMEEGNIVGWLKQVGDTVEPGDVLAEVETDKATMELDSYQEGVLLYIGVKEGPVPVDGILAVIGKAGEDYKVALAAAEASTPQEAGAPAVEKSTPPSMPVEVAAAPVAVVPQTPTATQTDQRIKASPLAKKMASEAGIEISSVAGTGDHGRIVRKDIETYIHSKPQGIAPKETKVNVPSFNLNGSARPSEDIPVSQMRKIIARRLGESKFTAPHFYLTIEMNMDKAIEARKQLNEVSPVRISFNDLVVKAAAASLRQHPAVNSSWLGDKIRINGDINIGVAVAVEDGLLVPVINHADMKSLAQINVEVKDLAGKAKLKKLQPPEMQGNTFTISNLGMFGIEEFTAIINPPDACILAVGGIIEKPIIKNGAIVPGNMMKVTLSCDHRVVDGATGAKFLQTFKSILEEPIRLLV
ncbi:MAG: pyruvate dehydrogenase E2 component (dihydrolipoamide acetyltransferase) [Saprospiraceae bacterium]